MSKSWGFDAEGAIGSFKVKSPLLSDRFLNSAVNVAIPANPAGGAYAWRIEL